MNNQINCDVIGDLYPVYSDGLCCETTRQLVEAHLSECEHCRRLYAEFPLRDAETEPEPPESEKVFRKLNRQLKKSKAAQGTAALLLVLLFLVCYVFFSNMPDASFRSLYRSKWLCLGVLILFLVLLLRTFMRTAVVIVMRRKGEITPANKKGEYGSVLFLWLVTALMFCAAVLMLVFVTWG